MELIDTHTHLTFDELSSEIEPLLQRSRDAGVTRWITVGTDAAENTKAVQLAGAHMDLYAAVGIHPHYAKDVDSQTFKDLYELAQNPNVVAIGETGLDFYYSHSPESDQVRAFAKQLEIAAKLQLPVIVHSRQAFGKTLNCLDKYGSNVKKVVFHCFGGDADQAHTVIERGWYISFTGVVTFKNADQARQAVRAVPRDRLMIETDCPFMSPAPKRNQKPNEPALMVHTAAKIAELQQIPLETLAQITTTTARGFFSLPR